MVFSRVFCSNGTGPFEGDRNPPNDYLPDQDEDRTLNPERRVPGQIPNDKPSCQTRPVSRLVNYSDGPRALRLKLGVKRGCVIVLVTVHNVRKRIQCNYGLFTNVV